jgi:carbon monoxide dehydrogenase subunit G
MQLSGDELFQASMPDLWSRLTDMKFMAGVIPDVERIEQIEKGQFTCRVRPRFAFFSGKVILTFQIIGLAPPDHLEVTVLGKGIGGAVSVDIDIRLEAKGDENVIHWSGHVVRKEGLFRPIGDSLISGAAAHIVEKLWAGFRAAMAAEPTDALTDGNGP